MIALVSCVLAAYEALAYIAPLPKVTQLSARRTTGPLVYLWLAWLFIHFLQEGRRVSTSTRARSRRPLR